MKTNHYLFFLILISLIFPYQIFAQRNFKETKKIDEAIFEAIYVVEIVDKKTISEQPQQRYILQVGKNYSIFKSYGSYKLDSMVSKMKDPESMAPEAAFALSLKHYGKPNFSVKNLKTKKYQEYDYLPLDHIYYEEQIPEIKYNLEEQTKEHLGLKCFKTTANFRGREWVIWYTPDIPISNGPWKLEGFPGMVVSATAKGDDGHYSVWIREIRKAKSPILLPVFPDANKMTREKYNQYQEDFALGKKVPFGISSDNVRPRPADKPHEVPYFQIELE